MPSIHLIWVLQSWVQKVAKTHYHKMVDSGETAINRKLHEHSRLKTYFLSVPPDKSVPRDILSWQNSKIESPNFICYFINQFVFSPPTFSYELLQRKGSPTYLLHDTLLSFLKKLLFKFVWIENIREYLCSISVSNRSIHCLRENVFIRLTIRQLLEKLVEYEEIGAGERDTFYNSFFELYIAIQFYNYRSVMLFSKIQNFAIFLEENMKSFSRLNL